MMKNNNSHTHALKKLLDNLLSEREEFLKPQVMDLTLSDIAYCQCLEKEIKTTQELLMKSNVIELNMPKQGLKKYK